MIGNADIKEVLKNLCYLLPLLIRDTANFVKNMLKEWRLQGNDILQKMLKAAFFGLHTPCQAFIEDVSTIVAFTKYTYDLIPADIATDDIFEGIGKCVLRQVLNMAPAKLVLGYILQRLHYLTSARVVYLINEEPTDTILQNNLLFEATLDSPIPIVYSNNQSENANVTGKPPLDECLYDKVIALKTKKFKSVEKDVAETESGLFLALTPSAIAKVFSAVPFLNGEVDDLWKRICYVQGNVFAC